MNRAVPIAVVSLALTVAACEDRTLAPTAPHPSVAAVTAPTSCPAHADFYVSDESSLMAAIDSARPGDTIALRGVVDLTIPPNDTLPGVFVQKDSLTFTCATPGSGIRAEPVVDSWLFVLLARHLTVEHLSLDATNSTSGAILAFNGPEDPYFGAAEDIRVTGNRFQCGGADAEPCLALRTDTTGLRQALITGNSFTTDGGTTTIGLFGVNGALIAGNTLSGGLGAPVTSFVVDFQSVSALRFTGNSVDCLNACLFADFSPGAVVTQNHFISEGSLTGVQLQGLTDGDSVIENTVLATVPSFAPQFGGIRMRDGANVVVIGNTVTGPWANSIALNDLVGADVERNTLQGAVEAGIGLATGGTTLPVAMTSNVFRANRVSAAGIAGITARLSCSNTFVGNDLAGNAGNVGMEFDSTTGANTYVGNPTVVVDNGVFDCNGDGIDDPNIISGTPRRGAVAGSASPPVPSPARAGGHPLK